MSYGFGVQKVRGGFFFFFKSTPTNPGEMLQFDGSHIFQMGWNSTTTN